MNPEPPPTDPISTALQDILAQLSTMTGQLSEERAARQAAEAQQQQLVGRLAGLETELAALAARPPPAPPALVSSFTADLMSALPSVPPRAPAAVRSAAAPAPASVPPANTATAHPIDPALGSSAHPAMYPSVPVNATSNFVDPSVAYPMQLNQLAHGHSNQQKDVKGPKVSVPATYDGTKGDKAETFIGQIGIYLETNEHQFQTDRSRVLFTISYLTGTASLWAQPMLKKLLADRNASVDWVQFGTAFEATFFDTEKKKKAEGLIGKLQQKGSVVDYTAKFNAYASILSEWPQVVLVGMYSAGLKSEISVNMVRDVFETVEECSKVAISIDNKLHGNRSAQTSTPIVTTSDPNAMDCSAVRYPISKELYQKRKDDDGCFKCGSSEHYARGCKKEFQKGKGKVKVSELEARIVELEGSSGSKSRADESKNGDARD